MLNANILLFYGVQRNYIIVFNRFTPIYVLFLCICEYLNTLILLILGTAISHQKSYEKCPYSHTSVIVSLIHIFQQCP